MIEKSSIEMYIHCCHCLKNKPFGISPSDWSELECGFTKNGFQVWCMRCNMSVIYLELAETDEDDVNLKDRKETTEVLRMCRALFLLSLIFPADRA